MNRKLSNQNLIVIIHFSQHCFSACISVLFSTECEIKFTTAICPGLWSAGRELEVQEQDLEVPRPQSDAQLVH